MAADTGQWAPAGLNWPLTTGSRLRVAPGARIGIDTPQMAVVASQPGEYRTNVDPRSDSTQVTVRSGSLTVDGGAGCLQI